MKTRFASIAALLLWTTAWGFSQEGTPDKTQNNFRLPNPEVVRIEILPRSLELHEDPSDLTKPYQEGDKIHFRLQMTNTSVLPIEVFLTNPYFQNRPTLYSDGETVPYRKGLSETLAVKDKELPISHNGTVRLEAGESKVLGYIDLPDWYEPLKPGHYELSVKHRFEFGQQWIESANSVTFEVVSKK